MIRVMMLTRKCEVIGHARYEDKINVEMWGIDPHTSRMQSERSTIWATTPLRLASNLS